MFIFCLARDSTARDLRRTYTGPVLVQRDRRYQSNREPSMSKSQDSKKAVKKEPLKTPKEKKEAKKAKKEASKRQ